MANGKKVKENDINNSKRRGFGSKGSTSTSGSATTDSLGLRRSTRETPTKKQSLSSTSNTRKSERLVTRSPVTTPVKRNSEPAEKQRMPSPLKKNERSEKQCSSSSSGSKTSEKCLSDARVWSRNEKQNPKPRMILIKKRLDARTYRALLNPQARISKGTADLGHRLKREDKQSQGDNYYHIGASGSKEVEEDGDECSEGEDKQSQGESYHIEASASKEVEEDGNECSEGENKQSHGESCHIGASGSKETEEDGDECSERRKEKAVGELSHFNCKQKNHHEENHDFESQDKLPVLETGGISGQSSPDRAVQKETKDDSNGTQVECSVGEDFQRPELMKSASKGRSLAGETGTGGADKAGILIRKRDTIDLDSDTSSTEASKEICSTTADAVSSSPSGSKMGNFIERCVVCSKRQRVDFDSREGDFCTCNVKYGFTEKSAKRKNQYRGISKRPWGKWVAETSRKGVRVRIGTFKTAEEAARAYDAESRRIRGKKAHLNFPEEMPSAAQKRTVKSNPRKLLPKANMTPEKQNLDQNLSLDRREPEAGDGTGVTEECLSDGQHDKTPLIFRTEADQNASVFNKLDSGGEGASPDALKVDSSYNNAKLECLAQFSPFEHKSESSKFVEYWVPVKLSSVQLEHYCGALFSNEPSLRSSSKNDSVGALRDMLISARKCCDHPYLLEPSLQSLLTKGLPVVEYLDVGIKASGKLQLLDKILQEMKRCGLRALILFQSFGLPTLGDILDDFLRQRFGPDSYERVDVGLSSRKKQAAMNMFNSRERGEFVFLLENRACHPSMKLLSVDAIILFDSDWNPLNDLRGLQRIHIDSQLKQIKVFRLYTPCTIEEQILNLAKQDMFLDGNLQNINHSYCHMLLIWGASYLFSKLDEFHGGNTSVSGLNILSNEPFMNAVVEELLIHLPQNAENTNKSNCSLTSKVKQSGASYSKDIPLLGESKVQLRDEEPPHVFWTKLLQGRYPRWRYYLSGSSQRIRKRVQYFDEPPRKSDVECDEVIKKRKKVADNTTDPISLKPWLEDKRKVLTGGKEGTSGTQASNGSQSLPRSAVNMGEINHVSSPTNEISGVSEGHLVESGERRKLNDAQKSLYLLLKPEISILCEILKLPGYIKGMAGRFLDYTMKNHHVNREPVAILHAFQISVCWTAASLLKYKINRKESLAHAKQILNFECNEEEADFIYSKLRILKKMFYRRIETSTELEPPEDSSPRVKDVSKMFPRASSSSSQSMEEELEEGEIRESSESHNFPPHVPAKQGHVTDSDKTSWSQKNDFSKGISQFDKICAKRMKKLLQKQQEEVQKFNEIGEKKRAKLEKELTLELALVRTLHRHTSTKLDKKKRAEQDHMKKVEEHNRRWEVLKKKLEDSQLLARNKENWRKAYWLEQARRGLSVERFAKLPLPDSWFVAGELVANHISGLSSEKSDPNMTFPIKPGEILPSKVTRTIPNETAEGSGMDVTLDMQPNREEDRTDATIALQSDGVGNRLDGLSLEKSDPNITFSIKPGEILPSKVTKTIPNETAEGSGMDVTLNLQPNREEDRTDATIALQSDGVVNRLDTMLDLQSNREDDEMDASLAVQSNENSNRMDTMLDLQPNREDDGMDAANVSMQSNGDSNRLDTTLDMQHNREDDRVDATSLDMQSNGEACGLDGTIAMHSVRDDNEVDNTVSMQPHRGNNRMDTTRGMQSCREDNAMDATALERETLARDDQHNRADSSNSVDLHSRDSSLPLDEILRVEHCEPPTSAAVQDEAVSSEMQNTPEQLQVLLLQPADVLPSDESNHDTSVTEPVQQLQLLVSMDPPCTACDQQDVPLVMGTYHETTCEGRSSFQQAQVQEHPLMGNLADPCSPSASTPPVEDCSEPPQSLPQPITPLLLHLPVERPSVGSVTLVSDTSMATIPESSNSPETVCSGGSSTHVPVTGGMGTVPESSNHPLQPTAFATQMCQPWFHDPLYVEMERLNKEKEQTIKLHGGLKLRLESERDKEIEEIHRKYAALLEEAETALLQKRKALDSNYNKVYMNKLLADAFRSKFNEQRETGAQGQRQGISTSFMQQLFQQSLQQHAQRPAPVSAPPAAPPLQIVHQSSALFSSNPVRQQISPVVPAAANFQVDSELRAPAPHLKHLRCSTSMLAPNIQPVPHNIPSQQALGNAASTSSMIPQLAPRAPTHSSGPFSRSQQLENAVGLAAGFSNSSLSALELLMDAGNHPGANQPSLLQPLPDLGPTLGSWGTAARPDPTADFVCISDDD